MRITVFLVVLWALLLSSCDFMLKKDAFFEAEEAVLLTEENDFEGAKDREDCAYESGYRWSVLRSDCIRVFEEGFRLNPIELREGSPEENELEDNDVSCFVIFDKAKNKAEIFLPNTNGSLVLKVSKTKGLFNQDGWELDVRGDMKLSYQGELRYTAAKTIELKVISTNEFTEDYSETE